MMIHLYTEDGKQTNFKKSERVEMAGPDNPEPETLYIYPGGIWVGFLVLPRLYRVVPQHNIKEIHFTRGAGQPWT